jgi:hypothetical protein
VNPDPDKNQGIRAEVENLKAKKITKIREKLPLLLGQNRLNLNIN